MSEILDLYQEVILDHHKRPRNQGPLDGATHRAEGDNPLCGDRVKVSVRLASGRIAEIRFEGAGCAIAMASASLMTEAVRGLDLASFEALFHRFHELLTGDHPPPAEELGKLAVFSGVKEFPVRVKCATLPWHTLRSALRGADEPVTTE